MPTATKTIDTDVIGILTAELKARLDTEPPDTFQLKSKLDRKVYLKVNKVVSALGGNWEKRERCHSFPDGVNAVELIGDCIATGEYLDAKTHYQAFFSPEHLAKSMAQNLGLHLPGRKIVLEPSAGSGVLAVEAARLGHIVHCVEIQDDLAVKLLPALDLASPKGNAPSVHGVMTQDFLELKPSPLYDVVLMNPPFRNSQDIAHVMHAYQFLAEGGRLQAVMSPGFTFRQDQKARDFRAFLTLVGGTYEELPAKTFAKSGTNVNTVLVSINN